jgi:hypothetical protein
MYRSTFRAALLCTSLLAATACATSTGAYQLAPVAAGGQDLTQYSKLKPDAMLESRLPGGTVVVKTVDIFSEYGASFAIAATNAGGQPVQLSVQDVSATAGGAPLHIYTAKELDSEITGAARAYLRSSDGAYDPTNTRDIELASVDSNRRENFNTFVGCPVGEGRCQIDSPDLGSSYRLERIDREQDVATNTEVAKKLMSELPVLTRTLHTSTVAPGATAGGLVVMKHPARGQRVDITVAFNGETHTFSYLAKAS